MKLLKGWRRKNGTGKGCGKTRFGGQVGAGGGGVVVGWTGVGVGVGVGIGVGVVVGDGVGIGGVDAGGGD